jgi:hypothetical protein
LLQRSGRAHVLSNKAETTLFKSSSSSDRTFMQAAKDSFYMALRERLAALNPARVIVVDGVERPAIVVRENMEPQFGVAQVNAYYLEWGDVRIAEATRPVLGLDCEIWYATEGSSGSGVDRGRMLAQMDEELLKICAPLHTEMRDYSQAPSIDLGCGVFWTTPELKRLETKKPTDLQSASVARLERLATLRVYFFLPEVMV